ncbi:MAG: altronate oxidoreductase, partial [Ginsengibacter sp.]
MQLSKQILPGISSAVSKPGAQTFDLPEKVLQFGTGVLLRGLPDYFIHKANQQNIFNGRVVVVKTTSAGSVKDFTNQDSLYTLCIRGIEDGETIEENMICSSISRVLSANEEWEHVL